MASTCVAVVTEDVRADDLPVDDLPADDAPAEDAAAADAPADGIPKAGTVSPDDVVNKLVQAPVEVITKCEQLVDKVKYYCVNADTWSGINVRYFTNKHGKLDVRIRCTPLKAKEREAAKREGRAKVHRVDEVHSVSKLLHHLTKFGMLQQEGVVHDGDAAEDDEGDNEDGNDDECDDDEARQTPDGKRKPDAGPSKPKKKQKVQKDAAAALPTSANKDGEEYDELYSVLVPKRRTNEAIKPWLTRAREAAKTPFARNRLVAALQCVLDARRIHNKTLSDEQLQIVNVVVVNIERDMGIVHPSPPAAPMPPSKELLATLERNARLEQENRELKRLLKVRAPDADADNADGDDGGDGTDKENDDE